MRLRDPDIDARRRKLGDALRAARMARGLSTIDVADATGLAQSMVSRVENGRVGLPKARVETYRVLFPEVDLLAVCEHCGRRE